MTGSIFRVIKAVVEPSFSNSPKLHDAVKNFGLEIQENGSESVIVSKSLSDLIELQQSIFQAGYRCDSPIPNSQPEFEVSECRLVSREEARQLGLFGDDEPVNRDDRLPTLNCDRCSFETKRPSHLSNHKSKHTDNETLQSCDSCPYKCLRLSDLLKHKRQKHEDSGRLKCNRCDFVSSNLKSLNHHRKQSHNSADHIRIFECIQCQFKSLSPVLFKTHQLKKHYSSQKPSVNKFTREILSCAKCKYKTRKASNLQRHSLIHSGERKFTCKTCGQSFKRSDTLKQHLAIHANDQVGKNVNVNLPRCDVCDKVCRSKFQLVEHKMIHSEIKSFLCDLCGMAFKTKATQKRHMKVAHTSEGQSLDDDNDLIFTLNLDQNVDAENLIHDPNDLVIPLEDMIEQSELQCAEIIYSENQ